MKEKMVEVPLSLLKMITNEYYFGEQDDLGGYDLSDEADRALTKLGNIVFKTEEEMDREKENNKRQAA